MRNEVSMMRGSSANVGIWWADTEQIHGTECWGEGQTVTNVWHISLSSAVKRQGKVMCLLFPVSCYQNIPWSARQILNELVESNHLMYKCKWFIFNPFKMAATFNLFDHRNRLLFSQKDKLKSLPLGGASKVNTTSNTHLLYQWGRTI